MTLTMPTLDNVDNVYGVILAAWHISSKGIAEALEISTERVGVHNLWAILSEFVEWEVIITLFTTKLIS